MGFIRMTIILSGPAYLVAQYLLLRNRFNSKLCLLLYSVFPGRVGGFYALLQQIQRDWRQKDGWVLISDDIHPSFIEQHASARF